MRRNIPSRWSASRSRPISDRIGFADPRRRKPDPWHPRRYSTCPDQAINGRHPFPDRGRKRRRGRSPAPQHPEGIGQLILRAGASSPAAARSSNYRADDSRCRRCGLWARRSPRWSASTVRGAGPRLALGELAGPVTSTLDWTGYDNAFVGWPSLLDVGERAMIAVANLTAGRDVWKGIDASSRESRRGWPIDDLATPSAVSLARRGPACPPRSSRWSPSRRSLRRPSGPTRASERARDPGTSGTGGPPRGEGRQPPGLR